MDGLRSRPGRDETGDRMRCAPPPVGTLIAVALALPACAASQNANESSADEDKTTCELVRNYTPRQELAFAGRTYFTFVLGTLKWMKDDGYTAQQREYFRGCTEDGFGPFVEAMREICAVGEEFSMGRVAGKIAGRCLAGAQQM